MRFWGGTRVTGLVFIVFFLFVCVGCKRKESHQPPRYPSGQAAPMPRRELPGLAVYGLSIQTPDAPKTVYEWYKKEIPAKYPNAEISGPPTGMSPVAEFGLNMNTERRGYATPIDPGQPAFHVQILGGALGTMIEMYWAEPEDK